MKKIYEFNLPKEELVKETTTETNDEGQETSTTTEVKKIIDKKLFLKRPTRKLFDEAELYYAIKLSEGIKAGLLTRALLAKRFSNDGGVLGESEKESFQKLYEQLFEKQVEHQALLLKAKSERTEEESSKIVELFEWLKDGRARVQEFEMQQSSLYDQTAENRARNKTILWWVLYLSYFIDNKDNEVPFFGDGDFDAKIEQYDVYEENEEDFDLDAINKYFYYVSFWYVSKTSDPKEFQDLIKYAEQADLEDKGTGDTPKKPDEEEPVEEEPEEEVSVEEVSIEEIPVEEDNEPSEEKKD